MVIAHDLPGSVQPEPAPEPVLTAAGVGGAPVCAECMRAELFAVQPHARCLSSDGPFGGGRSSPVSRPAAR